MNIGKKVSISVIRRGGAVSQGQTSRDSVIGTFTARRFMRVLLEPMSAEAMQSLFRVEIVSGFKMQIDWSGTGNFPIRIQDKVVIPASEPEGGTYEIKGVAPRRPVHVDLLIDVPMST